MQVAVTRRLPGEHGAPPFYAEEALSLKDAVHAFTMGSAYVNHLDHATGSISPGKLADLCVLDRDLFDSGAGQIADARNVLTMIEGEVVYSNGSLGL
jgi:predicted amidohydrolase YtcJ